MNFLGPASTMDVIVFTAICPVLQDNVLLYEKRDEDNFKTVFVKFFYSSFLRRFYFELPEGYYVQRQRPMYNTM